MKRSEEERRGAEFLKKVRKISVASMDGDSSDVDEDDDESDASSSLSYARRNWDFSGSIKDMRPVAPRRRSDSVKKAISPRLQKMCNDMPITKPESIYFLCYIL